MTSRRVRPERLPRNLHLEVLWMLPKKDSFCPAHLAREKGICGATLHRLMIIWRELGFVEISEEKRYGQVRGRLYRRTVRAVTFHEDGTMELIH